MESTEVFLPRIVSLLDEYYLYYCIRCYFVYVFNYDERIVQLCVIIHVYSRVGVRITIITNQSMSTVHLFTNITNKTVNCKFTNVIISENALNYLFVTLFFENFGCHCTSFNLYKTWHQSRYFVCFFIDDWINLCFNYAIH